jgi:hypothetical protein
MIDDVQTTDPEILERKKKSTWRNFFYSPQMLLLSESIVVSKKLGDDSRNDKALFQQLKE